MDASRLLASIQIGSPCRASWAEMLGDDRARFCRECNKCVYNIAMMSSAEVVSLIQETEGRVCMRLYRRLDGTVLTSDCPVAAETGKRGRVRRLVAWSVLGASVLLTRFVLQSYAHGADRPSSSGGGISYRLQACVDWAKEILGLRPAPNFTVGDVCIPVTPSPSSPGAENL